MARRLLVVDDEEHIRLLLARALARLGYDVFVADDGGEALTQLGRIDVDAVISDVSMPVMTGIEFAYAVIETYPFLPLLFLTASAVPQDLLARPLVRLLRKPATALDVVHQLDELNIVLLGERTRLQRTVDRQPPDEPNHATPSTGPIRTYSPPEGS